MRENIMRFLTSFLLVFLTGITFYLYFTMPFLKPNIALHSDRDVRILRGSLLLASMFSGIIVVLLWVVESSLASLIIRKLTKGKRSVRPSLALVMREFSLAYIPPLIFLLIIIPFVWFNLPDSTVTTVEELVDAARNLGSSSLYVNGMLALIMVSLSRYVIYVISLRFRLSVGWKAIAIVIISLLIVETLIALWGNLRFGVWGEPG